jgi:predicted nucleic acid-binding protein
MPHYLADTSAWNRSAQVQDRWSELIEANDVALCAPVRLELLYSARGQADYAALEEGLDGFPHLTIDERVETIAFRGQAALAARGQHRGPAPTDLLIAALAQTHGITLLHYDRHFDAISRVIELKSEWVAPRGTLD